MNLHKLGLLLVLLITAPLCYGVMIAITCILCILMFLFWIVACCEFSYLHSFVFIFGKYIDKYFDLWKYVTSSDEPHVIHIHIEGYDVSNV